MTRAVEQVVVVGRDIAVWLVALGLQRAFGRTGLQVQVIEQTPDLQPVDVVATTPAAQGLNRLLGIDEAQVLDRCSGVYALAQRFSGWSGTGTAFLHPYDTHGARLNNVEFIQHWVKARGEGMAVALEDFSLGAAAAKIGRFVEHTEGTELFSKATYGYRLDALHYAALLKHHALRAGVGHTLGEPMDVQVDGNRISRVVLADGRSFEADLYVDASGSDAVLASRLDEAGFESWSEWLPGDRLLTASAQALRPLPGFSDINAMEAGWAGLYPLQDRTGVVAVFDSAQTGEVEMLQAIARLTGLRLEGAVARPFAAGARSRPWTGNCVAIGAAAADVQPLDAAQLHLMHVALSHLVTLFPTRADEMIEADLYNPIMVAHAQNVRDFQVAHYKLNGRTGAPFWDRARAMSVPDSLQYKLDLFASRGRIAHYDDETFEEDDWLALFVGHGLMPRDFDPLAERMPQDEQIQNFKRMLRFIAVEAQQLPSLQAHLELSAPSRSGAAF